MNFKRELNLAQHIQEVANSQGWKETCKILDYVTWFLWFCVLGVVFIGVLCTCSSGFYFTQLPKYP